MELSGSIYMQISTKGSGNFVRVSRVLSDPGFELTGLYCVFCQRLYIKKGTTI